MLWKPHFYAAFCFLKIVSVKNTVKIRPHCPFLDMLTRSWDLQVSTVLRTQTAPSAEAAPDMSFAEFSLSSRLKVWHSATSHGFRVPYLVQWLMEFLN
jgi:hypothetical protein